MPYNHKLIKDLAWSIGSPCLVNGLSYTDDRLLTDDWFNRQIDENQALLLEQDKTPQLIQTYLSKMPTFKLGHYFENLIAYWFHIHPNFEILHQNLVISSDSRTIGEFDLIIKDLIGDKVIHLEVAVKFFLEVLFDNKTVWLGPNLIDSLDHKFNKLITKQIQLSTQKEALPILKSMDISIDEHWVLLKGRLFNQSNLFENKHYWINYDDFLVSEDDQSQWIILSKTHWLSEVNNLDYNFLPNEQLNKDELMKKLKQELKSSPICIAKVNNNTETKRLFITPNDWQERAINSLA